MAIRPAQDPEPASDKSVPACSCGEPWTELSGGDGYFVTCAHCDTAVKGVHPEECGRCARYAKTRRDGAP